MNARHRAAALSRRALWLLAAAGMIAAAVPAAALPDARDEITLTLKDKVIKDLSSSGLVLAFHIAVANPAPAPRQLIRTRYRVRIDQKEYINTEIALPEPLAVPASGGTLIALPVKITYDLLTRAIGPIEAKALCDIVGDMVFLTERGKEQKVPFAFSGEFPIFKDPEIDWPALGVNDLTVGGADVVFHARFRNPNPYDLIVDAVDFELSFSGRLVLSGSIAGDKSLPPRGGKTFDLPFLVDFFEAGDEVRAGFGRDEIPCRFAGRIRIASVWGPLVIRFERAGPLPLAKKPEDQNQ